MYAEICAAAARRLPPPLGRDDALFLDFDGTLVDLAESPGEVRVAAALPELLIALSRHLSGAVAIVSGRPIDELRRYLAPFDGDFAGQHGFEIRRADGSVWRRPAEPALAAALPALAAFAARHDGILIEDKGATLALHYRRAPHLEAACRALADAAVRGANGILRAIAGKMVIELVPRGTGKGAAIADLLAEPPFRGRAPVFVGDDVTDEDGFGAVEASGGVSVRVGGGESRARYRLATVGEVLAWLKRSCCLP